MSRHRSVLLLAVACAILAVSIRHLWSGLSSDRHYLIPNGDTTAVILNWSRLANVVKIVSVFCQPQLQGTIAQIFIWNNSPHKLNYTNFLDSKCPESRLKIYNSPSNLYFQARFFACEQSQTPYCFIQDDDFLILPEILLAMRSRINESSKSAIHLLPPHEMLSSQLRSVSAGSRIHTSFAWLGYGTIMPRTMASDFISLLRHLNVTEQTMKMADNYFTILRNTIPETWFDQSMELGGGQPFTAGIEGDKRNNRHIRSATQMLDSLLSDGQLDHSQIRFVDTTEYTTEPVVSRAPCLGKACIFETSIRLLPPEITTEVSVAKDMLDHAHESFKILSAEYKQQYIDHPPSHAVDGKDDTCFQSPTCMFNFRFRIGTDSGCLSRRE
ncbi:hypothetical protein AX14_011662 [Amanita brunnescens Koide BX004]|nr:hypothetical protein AX14_011662 [Amanita brunnescens Koide BX004]